MLTDEIDRFLQLQGKRWSESTVRRYRWYLINLADWLEEQGLPQEPAAITDRMLARWLDAHMHWASSTQYTGTTACRGFFRWAVGKEASPAEKLALPRRLYTPQRTLDETRVLRILACLDTSTIKGTRDTAMMLLLLDTGLRAAEICRLRLEHVDLAERRFSVRIKGGRWAEGVFSPYTASCLVTWVIMRNEVAKQEAGELFVGVGGETRGRKMTPDGLRAIFRQIGTRVGFHFSPHDFRRSFATMALKGGAPSRLVQVAGRWSSLEQVERYSQSLSPADFDGYSPVHRVLGLRVKDEDA